MVDIVKKVGKSLIQHGKENNRIYLIKLAREDYPEIINDLAQIAKDNNYTKIFAKVPRWGKEGFSLNGYKQEAYIPGFYKGEEDVFFMSKFLNSSRAQISQPEKIAQVLELAQKAAPIQSTLELESNLRFRILTHKDAEEMVAVYKKVFETYPFPIFNPEYLKTTMDENIVYFGIFDEDKLIAISSCEMDVVESNVEMTDFATLTQYRSRGLASFLLARMGHEMTKRGIHTGYTIARAASIGMNITFAKHGYKYTGTLVNNTNISGGIESMNVWYKNLQTAVKSNS